MPSTHASDLRDASPTRDSTPLRIKTTSPSAAPLVVKPAGRGSEAPLRFGRFLVSPGDTVALRHLLAHHLPAGTGGQRWERAIALAALRRGFEGVAVSVLRRRYGVRTPGPLEVDAVWTSVRSALKSCGLAGVSIRVHGLNEPAAGLAYGGALVGFGRRGSTSEADHPLVVVRVRPRALGFAGFVDQARALASVRGALPSPWRDLVPAPLAHRVTDDVEVLATGFLPGRALSLDLPRRPKARLILERAVSVAETLADLQNALRVDGRVAAGTIVPGALEGERWALELRERLDVRPVPLVPAHGTPSPDTILFEGARVSGIVGWSGRDADALPTRDLFDFLVAYACRRDSRMAGDPARLVRRAFVKRSRISRAIRESLVVYGARRELGLPTLGGLFRLYLLTREPESGRQGVLGPEEERDAAVRILEAANETVFTP